MYYIHFLFINIFMNESQIRLGYCWYNIPFIVSLKDDLSISEEAEEVIEVIDLQRPLSSPSVDTPPLWSVKVTQILELVGVTPLL